jgi:hypothetical protein
MPKTSRLRAGVSVVDVTPPVGYLLHGHVARNKPSNRVHDPLKLKVLTLSDGAERAALVTCDLIGFSPESVEAIRRMAAERFGLPGSRVFLNASHTHTGPCTSLTSHFMPGEHILPEYIRLLEKKVIGGIAEAIHSERPVTARWAADRFNIGAINRRKPTPAGLKFQPNPDGPVDDHVGLIRLDGKDGAPVALIVRYSCHPTVLSPTIYEISADYPGVAQAEIERARPGATAFFIQGCCGDVRPALYKGTRFLGGSFADAERMGRLLAAGALRMAEQARPVALTPIASDVRAVPLRFDPALRPTPANLAALARKYARENEESARGGWVRKWAAHWRRAFKAGERPARGMEMDLHVLRLGEVLLVGLAAEVMAQYGLWLRERLGGKLIVAGYTNGEIGYLPTREAIGQGGYEGAFHLYDMCPAPFDGGIQDDVLDAAERMTKKRSG